jgi:deoxyribonuclease IV
LEASFQRRRSFAGLTAHLQRNQNTVFLGAHVSISGGVDKAPAIGLEIGCEAIQIFTRNQMQWKAKPLTKVDLDSFRQRMRASKIKIGISHDSYLINLGSPVETKLMQSRIAFGEEIERCEQLGLSYLVFHPGSHTGAGEKAGLKAIADSINDALSRRKRYKTQLLLETTSGQGSNLGYTFEQLAEIVDMVREKDRVGICIDSCHIFAAGYDIRTRKKYEMTMKRLDEVVGLKKVKAFHLNDSKRELGSRVDRHEHIGLGKLGLEAFRFIVNDERFLGIPMVIETPGDHLDDRRNLETLKCLRKTKR